MRVVLAEELGDLLLRSCLWMSCVPQMKRTRRQAVAPRLQPVVRGLDDVGVVGEAEVVVRAEVDDLAAVDRDAGPLRRLDPPLGLVQPLRLEVVDLGGGSG